MESFGNAGDDASSKRKLQEVDDQNPNSKSQKNNDDEKHSDLYGDNMFCPH